MRRSQCGGEAQFGLQKIDLALETGVREGKEQAGKKHQPHCSWRDLTACAIEKKSRCYRQGDSQDLQPSEMLVEQRDVEQKQHRQLEAHQRHQQRGIDLPLRHEHHDLSHRVEQKRSAHRCHPMPEATAYQFTTPSYGKSNGGKQPHPDKGVGQQG